LVLGDQRRSQALDLIERHLLRESLVQGLERLDHDLAVACDGQSAGQLASAVVFAAVRVGAEIAAAKPQQGPYALQRRAGLVDGSLAVAVAAKELDRRLELTAGHAPDPVGDRLVRA
jgi:hypothetical protein